MRAGARGCARTWLEAAICPGVNDAAAPEASCERAGWSTSWRVRGARSGLGHLAGGGQEGEESSGQVEMKKKRRGGELNEERRAQVAPVTMGRVTYTRATWPAAWRAIGARARQGSLTKRGWMVVRVSAGALKCARTWQEAAICLGVSDAAPPGASCARAGWSTS